MNLKNGKISTRFVCEREISIQIDMAGEAEEEEKLMPRLRMEFKVKCMAFFRTCVLEASVSLNFLRPSFFSIFTLFFTFF